MFPAWMDEAFRRGGGQISVEEFMRLALYDPANGYYSKRIKTVGRGGDFSTAASGETPLLQAPNIDKSTITNTVSLILNNTSSSPPMSSVGGR